MIIPDVVKTYIHPKYRRAETTMDSQKLLSYLRQCIKKYDMIHPGDRIAGYEDWT